ncbi:MAG: hypothetical protein LBO81_05465 [Clostridiales Family XIII bacterium]|nr:hypothetical protein [Clostridiales Family XIII bacterium]
MNMMLVYSLIIFGVGVLFMALAGISFRIRAILNKPAWGGATIPCALLGLPIFIVGSVMIYIFY